MKSLFLGGYLDGKWIEVERLGVIKWPVRVSSAIVPQNSELVVIREEVYHPIRLCDRGKDHVVFQAVEDDKDPIERLIQGYHPRNDPEEDFPAPEHHCGDRDP